MRRAMLAVVGLAALGCTALSHDLSDLPRCEQRVDCEPLNERYGIAPDECMRYQCDTAGSSTCVLGLRDDDEDGDPVLECGGTDCDDADLRRRGDRPAGEAERCNGVDDDCDSIVDEGALLPDEGGSPRIIASELRGVSAMTAAADATGAMAVALSTGDGASARAHLRFVQDDTTERTLPLRYRTQQETPGGLGSPFTSYTVYPDEACYPQPTTCNMMDAVVTQLDPSSDQWLLAAVDDRGCAAGRLRVSWFDGSDGFAYAIGPPARAAPALGVDVASPGDCTGSSSGAIEGAFGPSVAALPGVGPRPQALAAYLARPRDTPECAESEWAIQAIGLWITRSPIGGRDAAWVDASGSNVPHTLGTTRGDGRPAVLALDEPQGYLVAYGDAASGGVALHFVPPVTTIDALDVAPECAATVDGCDTPHATPPIAPVSLGVIDTGGLRADHVGLAVGGIHEGRLDVGVSWQTGCDGEGVGFARVRVDASRPDAIEAPATVALAEAGRAPVPVYLENIVLPSYERDGVPAADQTGGWLVTWVEDARVVGRRVLEVDAQPLSEARRVSTVEGAPIVADRWTVAAASTLSARFSGLDSTGALLGGTIACAAPAE